MESKKSLTDWLKERAEAVADNTAANLLVVLLGTIAAAVILWARWINWPVLLVVSLIAACIGLFIVVIVLTMRRREKVRYDQIVNKLHTAPSPSEFVGREDEISALREAIRGNTRYNVLSVHGPPGIGKSWLLNRFAYEASATHTKWAKTDFRNRSYEPLDLLQSIQQQLGHCHFGDFQDAYDAYNRARQQRAQQSDWSEVHGRELLDQREKQAVQVFLKEFHELIIGQDVLLLFDTFENVENSKTSAWLEDTLHPLVLTTGRHRCIMVVGGWNPLRWHNGWETIVRHVELRYFTVNEVEDRLQADPITSGSDRQLASIVHSFTEGHPLAVGLAATLLREAARRGESLSITLFESERDKLEDKLIAELLAERILERLDTRMARLVRCCAIPRWFDAGIVRVLVGASEDSESLFGRLIGFGAFVQPHSPIGYEYHDIVRRLLLRQWRRDDSEKCLELHQTMLSYLETRRPDTSVGLADILALDAVYHAFNVNEALGMSTFRRHYRQGLDSYRLDLCEALLRELRTASPQMSQHVLEARYHEAKLMLARELWQSAQNLLESLTSDVSYIAEETQDGSLGAQVYFELGNLAARRSDNRRAVALFKTSLEFLQLGAPHSGLNAADILVELALACIVIGQMGEAERSLREAEDAMAHLGRNTSRLLLHQEVLCLSQGKWQDVIEIHGRFERLPQVYKNEIDRLRDSYHVAEATMRLGKLDEAMSMFETNYGIAKHLRNPYRQVFAQIGLARVLEGQGRWDAALDQLERAVSLLWDLGGDLVALSYGVEQGRVLFKAGRMEAARGRLTESLEAARELGHEYEVAEIGMYLGMIDATLGKSQQACEKVNASAGTFKRLGYAYQEAVALVSLLAISHDQMPPDDFRSIFSNTEELARKRGYTDLLAELYRIKGDFILQSTQHADISGACQAYADACESALSYNRHVLDTTITKIVSRLTELAKGGNRSETVDIYDCLLHYWKEEGLDSEETASRTRELGDGVPQTSLLDRLQQERSRLLEVPTQGAGP